MRFPIAAAVLCLAAATAAMGAGKAIPAPDTAKEKAPAVFKARFETTQGNFVVEVHRDWAPNGADRFYNMVKIGYFDGVKFFRVVPNFVVQFGIHGDPSVSAKWMEAKIQDDPVKESNKRGYLTFAQTSAPNSRSVQLFINLGDNARLDGMRFAPIGKVLSGMDVVDKFYSGYNADELTNSQREISAQGNAFLDGKYPKLDGIKKAVIE